MFDPSPENSRRGFVYVLTNESIPGLVKIGRTSRDVDLRATELWQTGVPTPFQVQCVVRTIDCVELEKWTHGFFHDCRVHKFREFFALDCEIARKQIEFFATIQARALISDHFDCVATDHYSVWVSGEAVERLSEATGQSNRVIVDAIQALTADEIAGPIQRVRAQMEQEHRELLLSLDIPEDEHWSVFE